MHKGLFSLRIYSFVLCLFIVSCMHAFLAVHNWVDNECSVYMKICACVCIEDKIRMCKKSVMPLPWTTILPRPSPPPYISKVKRTYDHVPSVRLTAEVIEASISLPDINYPELHLSTVRSPSPCLSNHISHSPLQRTRWYSAYQGEEHKLKYLLCIQYV